MVTSGWAQECGLQTGWLTIVIPVTLLCYFITNQSEEGQIYSSPLLTFCLWKLPWTINKFGLFEPKPPVLLACSCSVSKSCLTVCDPMDSFPILHLLKLMSIELRMPSNHLILCWPILLLPSIFPNIRVFSSELALHIWWPKYWSFSISPSSEYSGFISFRIDWFDWLIKLGLISLLPKGLSRVFSNFPCGPTLTSGYAYWKDHSLDYVDLCQQSDVSAF